MDGMKHGMLEIADGFWNIRGSFKVGGLVDIGTHASLVQLRSGRFVFLDSYTLDPSVEREVRALTNDGRDIDAILNVHPFHTIHVRRTHEQFPQAKLYGTARHVAKLPELPWEQECIEAATLSGLHAANAVLELPLTEGVRGTYLPLNDRD